MSDPLSQPRSPAGLASLPVARAAAAAPPYRRLLAAGAALALLFACFTLLTTRGAVAGVDRAVARWALQTSGSAFERVAAIGSSLWGVPAIAAWTALICAYWAVRRQPRLIVALVLALLAGGVAERGLRAVLVQPTSPVVRTESFQRATPATVVPAAAQTRIAVPSLGVPDARHSYPSGRLTLAVVLCFAAVLTPLWSRRRRAAVAALLLVVLVWGAWSEIYRGNHLFSDVAGAMLMGAALTLLCRALVERISRT